MDFGDTEDVARFRRRLRDWLADNVIVAESGEPEPMFLKRWHQVLHRGGWVGVAWPKEYGGHELGNVYDVVLNEEVGAADAPDAPRIGYLGRALLQWGTDEQKDRYLPGLLNGDDFWCQGFSEPEAGSDLANIATRATPGEGGYRITGQKVWSTYADHADHCLLLARTGPADGRHKGISAFVVPMDAPGVRIRPIVAITGASEFSEIFLDEVAVPEAARIGVEGDGWPIAMMTVAYERGAADVGYLSKFGAALQELRAQSDLDDAAVRTELGRLEVHYRVLGQHVRRRLQERESSDALPGPEMSVDKILMTSVDQALHGAALRLAGPAALSGAVNPEWLRRYLYGRAASIYGGSEQVQLNIIAQRLLGLPR
ncbi:MAG: acyl-CoA dehydrogenase family protein [Pseudonocardia sp.]|nr:acyl-CoA dehydrogenase family protein [Pseudonocardia sp.]